MKKLILALIISTSVLSACSLKDDAASLYKVEEPLAATIYLPENMQPNKTQTIHVSFTQNGQVVEEVDMLHVQIQKRDETKADHNVEVKRLNDGAYEVKSIFTESGLYLITVHAEHNDSTIMPTKQFAVGELSKKDLDSLQGDQPEPSGNHEHHH
jgi:YtkA-like